MGATLDIIDKLRALRGNISIDYDWQQKEARELLAQEERERDLKSSIGSPGTCAHMGHQEKCSKWIDHQFTCARP